VETTKKVYEFTIDELWKANDTINSLIAQQRLSKRELDAVLIARDCIYSVLTDSYKKD